MISDMHPFHWSKISQTNWPLPQPFNLHLKTPTLHAREPTCVHGLVVDGLQVRTHAHAGGDLGLGAVLAGIPNPAKKKQFSSFR